MNKLNPMYIIALFITILFISFFLLEKQKEEYSMKQKEYSIIEQKAEQFKEFKSNWNNEAFVNRTLDQILKNRIFRNQKVLKVKTSNSIKVRVESLDINILNNFLNKVLNKKLIIKKLDLNKNYIDLEVGLK